MQSDILYRVECTPLSHLLAQRQELVLLVRVAGLAADVPQQGLPPRLRYGHKVHVPVAGCDGRCGAALVAVVEASLQIQNQ